MEYEELMQLAEKDPAVLRVALSGMTANELTGTLKHSAEFLKNMNVRDPRNIKVFAAMMELLADEFEARFERKWGSAE